MKNPTVFEQRKQDLWQTELKRKLLADFRGSITLLSELSGGEYVNEHLARAVQELKKQIDSDEKKKAV